MGVFELAAQWGQAAGLAGIAIGFVLLIFRAILKKDIFPRLPAANATKVLTLLIVLTFGIGVIGIASWLYASTQKTKLAGQILEALVARAQGAGGSGLTGSGDYVRELPAQIERFTVVLSDFERIVEASANHTQRAGIERSLLKGDPNLAVEELRKASSSGEANAALARRTAGALLEFAGRFDEALAEYVRASDLAPGEPSFLSDAVLLAVNVGRHDVAKLLIEQRLQKSRLLDTDAYIVAYYEGLRGISLWFQGNSVDAKKSFDLAIPALSTRKTVFLAQVLNDSSAVYDALGDLSEAESRLVSAASIFRCALGQQASRTLTALYNLTSLYTRQGRYKKAQGVMVFAKFGSSSGDWDGLIRKSIMEGHIALGLSDPRSAASYYESARSGMRARNRVSDYRYQRLLRYLGEANLEVDNVAKGEEALQASLSIAQNLFGRAAQETLVVSSALSLVDARRGEHSKALAGVQYAETAFPAESRASVDFAMVLKSAAEVHLVSGDYAGALERFQGSCRVLKLNLSSPPQLTLKCLQRLREVVRNGGSADAAPLDGEIAMYLAAARERSQEPFEGLADVCAT